MTPSIYFIECCERVKVGYSTNAPRRIAGLSNACPYPCKTLGVIAGTEAQERQLHTLLAPSRRNGEWFERSERLSDMIAAISAGTVTDGLTAIAFLGGAVTGRSRVFERVFSAFPSIVEMSAALGVRYVTAQAMVRRDSINTGHWFRVCDALRARGHIISTTDLMNMTIQRRAA